MGGEHTYSTYSLTISMRTVASEVTFTDRSSYGIVEVPSSSPIRTSGLIGSILDIYVHNRHDSSFIHCNMNHSGICRVVEQTLCALTRDYIV